MKSPDNTRITSLDDLTAEMRLVKQRIQYREEELGKRWRQVPMEAVKATVGAVLPLFLGGELSVGVFKLVKGIFDLIKGKKGGGESDPGWKENLAGAGSKLGVFTALKLLFKLWRNK